MINKALYEITISDFFQHAVFPSELIVRWAQDVYEFTESQTATVELVTDSNFEASQINIHGFPRQIPDGHPNRFPSLVVPGPVFGGNKISNNWNAKKGEPTSPSQLYISVCYLLYILDFAFDATIERATSTNFIAQIFGNAQVTRKVFKN